MALDFLTYYIGFKTIVELALMLSLLFFKDFYFLIIFFSGVTADDLFLETLLLILFADLVLFLSSDFFLGFLIGADITSSTTLFNGYSCILSSFFICFTILG